MTWCACGRMRFGKSPRCVRCRRERRLLKERARGQRRYPRKLPAFCACGKAAVLRSPRCAACQREHRRALGRLRMADCRVAKTLARLEAERNRTRWNPTLTSVRADRPESAKEQKTLDTGLADSGLFLTSAQVRRPGLVGEQKTLNEWPLAPALSSLETRTA